MADEHAIGCETSESSRGEKAQHRVDAEALVAGSVVLGRADGFGNDERPVVREGRFLPEGGIEEAVDPIACIREFGSQQFGRNGETVRNVAHPGWNVNRNVVAAGEASGVAFVTVEENNDASDVTETGEEIVEAVGINRIDQPDITVDC